MDRAELEILIKARAELSQLDAAHASIKASADDLERIKDSVSGFFAQVRAGFNLEIGQQIAGAIRQIPAALDAVIDKGVQFNATLESARIGIAGVLRTFDTAGQYKTFQDAMVDSAKAIDMLQKKALESPATFEGLVQSFQATAGAMSSSGMTMAQQIETIVSMSQTLAGMGIRPEQMISETRALITGNINVNSDAAKTLEITKAEIDAAKAAGRLYEFLQEKQAGFIEAAKAGATSYITSMSNVEDAYTQAAGRLTTDIFEHQRQAFLKLGETISKKDFAEGLDAILEPYKKLKMAMTDGQVFLAEHAKWLKVVADVAEIAGAALAGSFLAKTVQTIPAVVRWTAGMSTSAAAIEKETQSLSANTAAQNANAAARMRAATATMPSLAGLNANARPQQAAAGGFWKGVTPGRFINGVGAAGDAMAAAGSVMSFYTALKGVADYINGPFQQIQAMRGKVHENTRELEKLIATVSSEGQKKTIIAAIDEEISQLGKNLEKFDSLNLLDKLRAGITTPVQIMDDRGRLREMRERISGVSSDTMAEHAADKVEAQRTANQNDPKKAEFVDYYNAQQAEAQRQEDLRRLIETSSADQLAAEAERLKAEIATIGPIRKDDPNQSLEDLKAAAKHLGILQQSLAVVKEGIQAKLQEAQVEAQAMIAADEAREHSMEQQAREIDMAVKNREEFLQSLNVLRLQAAGQDEMAARLLREHDVREQIAQLQKEGSLTEEEAKRLTAEKLRLLEKMEQARRREAEAAKAQNLLDQEAGIERTPGGTRISQDPFTQRFRADSRALDAWDAASPRHGDPGPGAVPYQHGSVAPVAGGGQGQTGGEPDLSPVASAAADASEAAGRAADASENTMSTTVNALTDMANRMARLEDVQRTMADKIDSIKSS